LDQAQYTLTDRTSLSFGLVSGVTVTLQALIAQYGRPDFVKIDIEGADRDCILSLTQDNAPPFLSFEAHDDLEELLAHGYSIGYRNFKLSTRTHFEHCRIRTA